MIASSKGRVEGRLAQGAEICQKVWMKKTPLAVQIFLHAVAMHFVFTSMVCVIMSQ